MSVEAFQRHHSTNEKSFTFFAFFVVLRSVSLSTSACVLSGTNMSSSAASPFFAPEMRV